MTVERFPLPVKVNEPGQQLCMMHILQKQKEYTEERHVLKDPLWILCSVQLRVNQDEEAQI